MVAEVKEVLDENMEAEEVPDISIESDNNESVIKTTAEFARETCSFFNTMPMQH